LLVGGPLLAARLAHAKIADHMSVVAKGTADVRFDDLDLDAVPQLGILQLHLPRCGTQKRQRMK